MLRVSHLSGFMVKVSPAVLLLDTYTGAAFAWSFRKLRTAYAGNAVRLIRASDSAESDFGFSGNDFDTAGAATWIGASSARLMKFYDQSGNGVDITADPTDRPTYSATGLGSKPSAFWRAPQGRFMSVTNVNLGLPTAASAFAVAAQDRATCDSDSRILSLVDTGLADSNNNSSWAALLFDNTNANFLTTANSVSSGTIAVNDATAYGLAAVHSTADVEAYKNGTASGSPGSTSGWALGDSGTSFVDIAIGRQYGGANYFGGWISEMLFYTSDQTSNVSGVYSNQSTYWGV
jgi:hypothetical protein